MHISAGVLYSVQLLLSCVEYKSIKASEISGLFQKYGVADTGYVLEIAISCRMVSLDLDDLLSITSIGIEITNEKDDIDKLRLQIYYFIKHINPPWRLLIPNGRSESEMFLPPNVVQIFRDAQLFDYGEDVITWWDKLATIAGGTNENQRLFTKRSGEKLSILYEFERTGEKPYWNSVESSMIGYDLKSKTSRNSDNPLLINVKTSELHSTIMNITISRSEWEIARNPKINYVFHLWTLHPRPKLFILDANQISVNIPVDNGSGKWEGVSIEIDTSLVKEFHQISSFIEGE